MTPKNSVGNTLDRSAGVPPALSRAPRWATLVATFIGIGRIRPGPGTWASASTVLLWWLLTRWFNPGWQTAITCVLACLAVVIGIPAATRVGWAAALKDPQFVVIDEVAGQAPTFFSPPPTTGSPVLCLFIFFR